jgi:hypothetical protein
MAEPSDTAVLGVASALKSLRTRTGLREERLHGTELVLDPLTGLDIVRALVSAGESPERAIVRAVCAAAGTLAPTMSIVADASLGLGLSKDLLPDVDLYAEDLGQRREALLRNWDRLHQLRSAPPGKPPSPRALRFEVESEALTALAVALTRGANSGELIGSPAGAGRPRTGSLAAPTLLQMFQDIAKVLRDRLARGADGRPTGWPRDLRELPGNATAASTAYGIRAMLLLEDGLAADLTPVAESLRKMAFPSGGFANLGQSGPRPEATAAVLNALRRIAVTEDFGAHLAQMEQDLGAFEKSRPFILTMMLETSLLFGPGSSLVEVLVDSLLAARRPYGDLLLWPEKSEPLLIDPAPSVAHTARAVRALARVQAMRPARQVQDALDQAAAWLMDRRELHNTYELLERPVDGRTEVIYTAHFTAAWVVKALVTAGVAASHPAVGSAVARIWSSYGGDTVALWRWDNGDLPIWMTYDAIEALRLANLAIPGLPGPAGPRATGITRRKTT